jgi:hypothetical protein
VLVALTLCVIPLTLLAARPHYKKGGQPVCTATGDTVTCSSGEVAGLGNFDIFVDMTFTASQGQVCHNPGNTNSVPGQNPATGTGGGSVSIPGSEVKNGSVTIPPISGTANIQASDAAGAGCPNPQWTVTLEGPVTISGGQYIFQSPPGTTIPSLSFTF